MKLRIRPRIVVGFLIMSILLVIVGVFSVFYTNRMQKNTARILIENVTSLKSAEELEIALLDMKGLTANYLLDGQQKWLDEFITKQNSFFKWLNQAKTYSHSPEEEQLLDEIEISFYAYLKFQEMVVKFYQNGNFNQAYKTLTIDMRNKFNLIYNKCEEVLLINEKMMWDSGNSINRDNKTVNRIMYSIGFLGILLGFSLGLILARGITHSIYELVLKVKGVTNEEIVEKVDIAEETEMENLSKHVRRLIEKVHEVNKDLERSQKMLARSEKLAALGQMAAGLAHEIRNPLTAIKMLIFTLQKEAKQNSQASKDFGIVLKEIERMDKFLQNFLDFARPPEPKFDSIDINKILKHTTSLLSPQIKTGKIELVEKLETRPAPIYGDEEQLQIVFVNILLNAIQSIPPGGSLRVESHLGTESYKDGSSIQIKIIDTGPGIPPGILTTIFNPFVSGREKGTGLGLSIANQIIHNHGGSIEAVNNSEKGATFIVTLPIIDEKER